MPRKTIKARPGGVSGPLSDLESGHTAPFSPQDSVVHVYLSIAATAQDLAGRDPHPDSDRDCVESVDELGEYCYDNNIKYSKTWDVFPFN